MSFVKYLRRLNPNCPKLFQKLRREPKNQIYFDNVALGHNRLGSFMPELSKAAHLSQVYTNHSLRATTVHVLDSAEIPSRHIMTVTGHKAESSLKTYSGKTDDAAKRRMSEIINRKLETKLKNVLVKKTTNVLQQKVQEDNDGMQLELTQMTSSQTETFFQDLDFNDNNNDNFLNFNNENHDKNENVFSLVKDVNIAPCNSTAQQNPQMPVFNNCSNITINFMMPKQ